MHKKDREEARMRAEILEIAQAFQAHGVMSNVEVAKALTCFEANPPKARERVAGSNNLT